MARSSLALSTYWRAARRPPLLLDEAAIRDWTGRDRWPTGRRVAVHADPWSLGIRQIRRALAERGGEPRLPHPLDQLERLTRLADGSHERASLTLADGDEFLGFATLARRLLAEPAHATPDRAAYELDLMYLWVVPERRGEGLGSALAAAVGVTAREDYRALARGAAGPLAVATLLFADFLTPRGAAVGRRVVRALTEGGLGFVADHAGIDMTLRLAPPRLVEEAAA
jgi:GNAT superfamily N-acetyltransferase